MEVDMYALVMVVVLGLISMDGPDWTTQWTAAEVEAHRARASPDVIKPAEKVAEQPKPPQEPKFPVNINTASADELDTLPGVGPATAERIMAHRAKRKFRKTRDIQRVKGIGKTTFQRLESKITVLDSNDVQVSQD
jgi:competence protein ComEA